MGEENERLNSMVCGGQAEQPSHSVDNEKLNLFKEKGWGMGISKLKGPPSRAWLGG